MLKTKIKNRIKHKIVNNSKINGEMLLNLTKSYINSINTGGIPTLETAWK